MNGIFKILIFTFTCQLFADSSSDFLIFTKSFLDGYTFNQEGRFTREYHPDILKKTQVSLAQLEDYLASRKFKLDHRLLIMGYEHNAIPRYFNCLSQPQITDETHAKTTSGWDFAAANLFGLLTGYLFKDAGEQKTALVQHVQAHDVELFAPNTTILREHAFGKWHDFIVEYQSSIQKHIRSNNMHALFNDLINFWQSLYESESKNCQAKTIATQDILFSLYYVKHLLQSTIPIKTLFVGPDLTYPIEVTDLQPVAATHNAQTFVRRFVDELKPINNEKTAYIFWSFVDGVGKSTLLGNITNWQQHKVQFDRYQHVSNTSSQRATLYNYTDTVIIADLPAQVSHYCAKPEGSVYIDLGFCVSLNKQEKIDVLRYVQTKSKQLIEENSQRAHMLHSETTVSTVEDHVIKMAQQCTKHPQWAPFAYNNQHFVFNIHDPRQIRVLTPLDQAHSQGLKIKEPELMIFDKGLAIPMKYDHFMQDLADQLAAVGVRHIVIVDFMGMYPRTSRETVRVNYFIQQLKEFYADDFDLSRSVYKSFTNQYELYPLFTDHKDKLERNLFLETLLRWVVYDTIRQASTNNIQNLSQATVHDRLRAAIDLLYKTHPRELEEILSFTRLRIEQELSSITHYQFSSFYEAISRFKVERFAQLAEMVRSLAAHYHPQDTIRDLWTQLGAPIASFADAGRTCILTNGLKLRVIRTLNAYDLDQALITTLSEQARRTWYEHIVGLIVPELHESYKEALLVKSDEQQNQYLVYYQHEPISDQAPVLLKELPAFGISDDSAQRPSYARSWIERIIRTEYQQNYHQEASQLFVPLERLCTELDYNNLWTTWLAEPRDMRIPKPVQINYTTVQIVVQALATLHMNLKSPRDKLMVRYGNHNDFVSTLRIWHDLMLPKYLNIALPQPLFTDYAQVKPLVGTLREVTV